MKSMEFQNSITSNSRFKKLNKEEDLLLYFKFAILFKF